MNRKQGLEMLSCWHGTHEGTALAVGLQRAYTRLNCKHLVIDMMGSWGFTLPGELMAGLQVRSSHSRVIHAPGDRFTPLPTKAALVKPVNHKDKT